MSICNLKNELLSQKVSGFHGNVYQWTQVSFAYHSSSIEENQLSKEQIEMIYETHSFLTKGGEVVKVDDVIEAANHFKLFDYMLDNLDVPLNKAMFSDMNAILKRGTIKERDQRVVLSSDKDKELDRLLEDYHAKSYVSFWDIIDFHARFENISPFQDGRVGRMILYKECLMHDVMPLVVLKQNGAFYQRGIREYDHQPLYLIDTCLYGQGVYEESCRELLDFDLMQQEV